MANNDSQAPFQARLTLAAKHTMGGKQKAVIDRCTDKGVTVYLDMEETRYESSKPLFAVQRLIRAAMRHVFYLLVLVGSVGCRHSSEHTPPWNEPLGWSKESSSTDGKQDAKPLPEFAEDQLSGQQKVALEAVRKVPMTVVVPSKFEDLPSQREIYTNWFFRGYTFTKATGWTHHHHSLYQNVTSDRRPIIEGWLDGQLHADLERIRSVLDGMGSAAGTNRTLLYITNPTNAVSISNAVSIASGLRLGMTAEDVQKYMREHGVNQTNLYSMSLDRGRTLTCPYPLAGGGASLMLEMECSQPPTSGLFGWKNPLLKGAYIQSQGVSIIAVPLTNAP